MAKSLPMLGSWRSFEDLQTLNEERLAEFFPKVRGQSFYSHLPEEFQSSPIQTKDHLRKAGPFGLLAVPKSELATYHESSGTTGEPISSYFTEGDWDDITGRFLRNAIALDQEDTFLVKTPYALVTTAHQAHQAARKAGALVVPADNRSTNMPYPKVVELLEKLPVTTTWCLPTETLLWAETARLLDRDPAAHFPKLRAFLVAGEPMSREKRKRISEIWGGAKVFEDYGSTETGSLAGECAFGKLHLWADRIYCEVFDEKTGRFHREGSGRLVVTPLYREAMPLIRYAVGDDVTVSHEACPCGWHLPTVTVLGRSGNTFQVAGKVIRPVDIERAIYSLPKEFNALFWRARTADDKLEIEIAVERLQEKAVSESLEESLKAALAVPVQVRAGGDGLVPRERLLKIAEFQKPRYLFSQGEDWSRAIFY